MSLIFSQTNSKKKPNIADSEYITNWRPAQKTDLQWKNSSLEQSLSNLQEIYELLAEDAPWQELYLDIDQRLDLKKEFLYPKKQETEAKVRQRLLLKLYQNQQLVDYFNLATSFWENFLKNWLTSQNKSLGDYLWPLRVALSGSVKSPSPFELLAILTKDQTLARLEICLGLD